MSPRDKTIKITSRNNAMYQEVNRIIFLEPETSNDQRRIYAPMFLRKDDVVPSDNYRVFVEKKLTPIAPLDKYFYDKYANGYRTSLLYGTRLISTNLNQKYNVNTFSGYQFNEFLRANKGKHFWERVSLMSKLSPGEPFRYLKIDADNGQSADFALLPENIK